MKTPAMLKKGIMAIAIMLIAIFNACEDGKKSDAADQPRSSVAKKVNFYFESPKANQQFALQDSVSIKIAANENTPNIDSAVIYVNGQKWSVIYNIEDGLSWFNSFSTVGKINIKAEVYFGTIKETVKTSPVFLSDITPNNIAYKVVQTYPHDKTAFTQGLIYADGYLYEGTGQKGYSDLRKVNLADGKIEQQATLSKNLFGEGITLFNNQIIQLSWQSGIGLVYDKNTFEQLSKFYYNSEGWGITNDSTQLIMSDGTHILRFLNPADFRLIREMEVYDDKGAIGYINELEWINGKIYANIWQKDHIVIIDPLTGKVTGKINLNNLLSKSEEKRGVLNGIAYDHENNRLFVTGKYWPKLFEIELQNATSF